MATLAFFFGLEGRFARRHWWAAQALIFVLTFLATATLNAVSDPVAILAIALPLFPLSIWMNFASTIKRFHDRGKSGLWSLMLFVPWLGLLWVLVECGCLRGTDGRNSHGSAV